MHPTRETPRSPRHQSKGPGLEREARVSWEVHPRQRGRHTRGPAVRMKTGGDVCQDGGGVPTEEEEGFPGR